MNMTQKEKIELLEDLFEADAGTITPEIKLSQVAWDSMAMLSLIALVSEKFGKRLNGADIRAFETVQDILAVME